MQECRMTGHALHNNTTSSVMFQIHIVTAADLAVVDSGVWKYATSPHQGQCRCHLSSHCPRSLTWLQYIYCVACIQGQNV